MGGIGSGKTISVIKELVERSAYSQAYVNFKTKKIPGCHRIKMDMIITKETEEGSRGKLTTTKKVNWQFWNELKKKNQRFSIYLDEVHNILNSRMSMSKNNVLMGMWIAQIRKVFGGTESDHLYIISQKLRRIDVNLRDLAHWVIECNKVMIGDKVIIIRTYYQGADAYEMGVQYSKTYFTANPFFKYYDSYELVDFGSDVYL